MSNFPGPSRRINESIPTRTQTESVVNSRDRQLANDFITRIRRIISNNN